jgi:hypothetical protein
MRVLDTLFVLHFELFFILFTVSECFVEFLVNVLVDEAIALDVGAQVMAVSAEGTVVVVVDEFALVVEILLLLLLLLL